MKKLFTILLFFGLTFGQTYSVGDTIDNFTLDICENGEGVWEYHEEGTGNIVWMNLFTSWWPSCQAEAPQSENMWYTLQDEPVVVLGVGSEWTSYTCESWVSAFGITYPMLDDVNSSVYWDYGSGYIPHNVILDHQGVVLYSQSGFNSNAILSVILNALTNIDADNDGVYNGNDNCPDDYNPEQQDDDSDGLGNACDDCNNLIFTGGNLDGNGGVDIFDVLMLIDVVLGESENVCSIEASDYNGDGIANILDVIGLVQSILGGNQQQAIQFLKSLLDEDTFNRLSTQTLLSAYPNPSNGNVNIMGNGLVKIYDMRGRILKEQTIINNYNWNTQDIPSGIYYIISEYDKIKITILK